MLELVDTVTEVLTQRRLSAFAVRRRRVAYRKTATLDRTATNYFVLIVVNLNPSNWFRTTATTTPNDREDPMMGLRNVGAFA